jgi:uncharacterized protein (DUF433 family)
MKYSDIVTIDPEILHGTPVFKGTRVPAQSLFWHLEEGVSLDEFLDDFPTVTKQQALDLLELSGKIFTASAFKDLYEITLG